MLLILKIFSSFWMTEATNENLKSNFCNHPEIITLLEQNKKAVQKNEVSPFAAAQILLGKIF
jgi:LAO/AO transport system kinase